MYNWIVGIICVASCRLELFLNRNYKQYCWHRLSQHEAVPVFIRCAHIYIFTHSSILLNKFREHTQSLIDDLIELCAVNDYIILRIPIYQHTIPYTQSLNILNLFFQMVIICLIWFGIYIVTINRVVYWTIHIIRRVDVL